jgi:hypothetical protein
MGLFDDLLGDGGSQQSNAESIPVTQYSIPKRVLGTNQGDELYDPGTARGVGITENELGPGVVGVNPAIHPYGTIFKDADTNEVFIAGDKHGNSNPKVVDIYVPPSQYTGTSGTRKLVPIDQIPLNQIPKTASGVNQLLTNYGKVPQGEGAYQSLNKKSSGGLFDDLLSDTNQQEQAPVQEQQQATQGGGLFDDLLRQPQTSGTPIPSEETGKTINLTATPKPSPKGNVFDQALAQYPLLKNANPVGLMSINAPDGDNLLESWQPNEQGTPDRPRPKELPVDKLGVQIYSNKTTPNDVAADIVSHSLVKTDPTLKATYDQFASSITPEQRDFLMGDYEQEVKQATLSGGEKPPQFDQWLQQTGIPSAFRGYAFGQYDPKAQQEFGYTDQQKQLLGGVKPYLQGGQQYTAQPPKPSQLTSGLAGAFEGTMGLLGGLGAGAITEAVGIPTTGPIGLIAGVPAFFAGMKAGQLGAKAIEKKLGFEPQVQVSQQEYPKTAFAGQNIPMLPMAAESALGYGTKYLAEGLGPALGQAATQAGIGAVIGEPIRYGVDVAAQKIGATEEKPQPITPGSIAETAAYFAGFGGKYHPKAPSLDPSANPVVNQREAAINAAADAQYSPITIPVVETPAPAPVSEVPVTPAQVKIDDLFNQQWQYEEGSPEWNAIQAQIDQLQNAPASTAEKVTPPEVIPAPVAKPPAGELTTGAKDILDLINTGTDPNSLSRTTLLEAAAHNGVRIPEGATNADIVEAIKQQQTETKNAVQEQTTGEVGVRNAPTVGEGVGEQNKPEEVTQEGEKPKEEVAPITKNTRITNRDYKGYPKGTQIEIISQSKDPLSRDVKIQFPDGKIDSFPKEWLKEPKVSSEKPKESLPNLVKTRGRDAVNDLLNEWNEAELSLDGKYILGVVDPRSSMKPERIPVREFLDWLQDKESKQKQEVALPTIETHGEGNLFQERELPFNLAGETMALEPEKPTIGKEEEQQLPMGESPKPAEPEKPTNPYLEVERRYYGADADAIKTHGELADVVEKIANKQRNKFLKESVQRYRDALEIGADMEPEVERLLADVEQEANYHDQGIKPSERGGPKSAYRKPQYFGGKNGNEVIRYLQENKILPKREWEKQIRQSGQQVKGGEYDDVPELPKKHAKTLYGTNGEGQSIDVALQGLHEAGLGLEIETVPELWQYIKEASDSAIKEEKETTEQSRAEKKVISESERLRNLAQTDPEKYASEMEQDLKDFFNSRRGEGAFIEFPDAIKDASIAFGNAVRKGTQSFRDWSRDMVSRLGNGIRGYLRQIWGAIKGSWNKDIGGGFDTGGRSREQAQREAEAKYGPKPPTEQETFAKKVYDTSVKQRGKPPTQEEMQSILSRKFPGITSREVSDLYDKASGKPKAEPYLGVQALPEQSEMFPQRTTGLKKEVVTQERLARGINEIPKEERQPVAERVSRAVSRAQADPTAAKSLIARVVDAGQKNITPDDAATLLVERNRLMNEKASWENILDDETKSDGERKAAKEQLDSIEQEMNRLDMAQAKAGSEAGRLLQMYQTMIKEDFSVDNMQRRARRALGRPLEAPEREAIKKQSEEIQKEIDDLGKLKEKDQISQEKADVSETYWKTIQELKAELASRPKVEPQIQRLIEKFGKVIKDNAKSAKERVRQRIREGRFNAGLNPEDIIDHAIIGADYIFEGATDIAKFTTRMVKELGEYVRPYIKEIFAASQKEYDSTGDRVAGKKSEQLKENAPKPEESIEQIKARGKAEKVADPLLPGLEDLREPMTHKLVYELARKHILDGVKGEDNVMKAVHNDIKDIYPDATERDVRRAFSEYGKAKYPNKEADRVALAELRTLTRLQESIDRLNEGLKTKRTGLQRNRVTQEIREKTAKLNELLKKYKGPTTPEELASRDTAKQTALRNRIADLDKQLRTGEKLKRTPTEPDSPQTENLRLEKNAMEQLLKEIEGEAKPKKTPEEAYNERRQKAIEKKMAEIKERIRTNNYEKAPKRIPTAKTEETQRKELSLKRLQNEFERKLLKYEEQKKPVWAKVLQGTSEAAKGLAITGYHSLEKILGFDLAKMVTTPIEEFTGAAVSMLPGMKPKEGSLESGGGTTQGLIKYYKGLLKGAAEAPKVYKTGLSESEELFGKVRPNVARWYDWFGGRLHAALKHIPFTAQEELYRYRGLANAEKASPGSSKNDLVRAAIYKAAYEKAQSAKLQEANNVADAINGYFRKLEQIDPKTGRSSVAGNVVSTIVKTFITKGIIKTPANYFKQVMRGIFALPVEVPFRLGRAYWNGIDNLTATESDAIYKAFKVGGIGFAAALYGYIDSFKDKKDRVLGGYYQSGRKEGDGDTKWGTIRINGHVFHYISHNPVTEIMQFGSTVGRVQQALMKKTDMPTAVATGFAKSLIAMLGNAPVSGPIMRLGQPNANPVQEIAGGLVPALIANIAADTDEGAKRKPTTIKQQIEYNIPGLRQNIPLARSGNRAGTSTKPWYEQGPSSKSNKPWYAK